MSSASKAKKDVKQLGLVYYWAPLNKILNFKIQKMNIGETPVYQVNSTQLEWILQKILDKKFEEYIERSYKPEVIYTRDDAAKILGVRPNTISNYIDNKRLTNRGIGRKILISSLELDRILNKNRFN